MVSGEINESAPPSSQSAEIEFITLVADSRLSRMSSVDSLPSLVDSEFAVPSLSSASTVSVTDNAFQRVLGIFKDITHLKDLHEEMTIRPTAAKFNRNLGTLLKSFAFDLEKEATCWNELRAAQFIRGRARKMAQEIADFVYSSAKVPSLKTGREEAENSEDSGAKEGLDQFQELEHFITNSAAFQSLHDNILWLDANAKGGFKSGKNESLVGSFSDEDDQMEAVEENVYYEQQRSCHNLGLQVLSSSRKTLRKMIFPEPPVLKGLSRVKWRCVSSLFEALSCKSKKHRHVENCCMTTT